MPLGKVGKLHGKVAMALGSVSVTLGSSASEYQLLELGVRINQEGFAALIDSGATHNFISQQAVEKAGLNLIETNVMEVKLATCIRV